MLPKNLAPTLASLASLAFGTTALASTITMGSGQFVTFSYMDVASWDLRGDPDNVVQMETAMGGYMATEVVVSGTLTEVDTVTWADDARIEIVTPGGSIIALSGGPTGSYIGPISVGPTTTSIFPPFDPAGSISFEFFESFEDAPDGIDQIWNDVTIELREGALVTNEMFAVGALPDDGTMVTSSGRSHVPGGLDFFEFSVGPVGPGGYLNIQTLDPLTGDPIDTEIGLYDSSGNLVADDDDGQESALGGLYSMLSFGVDDPLAPGGSDANAGEDGGTLPAGMYTLVTGGFNTVFGATLASVSPGTDAGDYDVKFTYSADASLILSPDSVIANTLGEFSPALGMIDQSGLSAGFISGRTNFDAYLGGNPTHLADNFLLDDWISTDPPPGTVDFDLGNTMSIERLMLWNVGLGAGANLNEFEVFTSPFPDFSTSTSVGTFFATSAGNPSPHQVFDIADSFARFVRIEIVSNHGSAQVGISEIAFAVSYKVSDLGVPTIDLPTPNFQSTPMTVAYHPGFNQYYGADGGNPIYRGWVWDADGAVIQDLAPIGVDVRGIHYSPMTNAIEVVTYNAINGDGGNIAGLMRMGLSGSGLYTGSNVNLVASLLGLAGMQTAPGYDPDRDLLYSRDLTADVNVVDALTGVLVDTITLDLAAAGNPSLQDAFIGYDADEQALVALDASAERAVVFDLEGTFLGISQLSDIDPANTLVNTGYANGQLFVFDAAQSTYHGFQIFLPEPSVTLLTASGVALLAALAAARRRRRSA